MRRRPPFLWGSPPNGSTFGCKHILSDNFLSPSNPNWLPSPSILATISTYTTTSSGLTWRFRRSDNMGCFIPAVWYCGSLLSITWCEGSDKWSLSVSELSETSNSDSSDCPSSFFCIVTCHSTFCRHYVGETKGV